MSDEDARALTAFLISQKGGGKSPLPAKAAGNGAPAEEVATK
jgi:hypothetical protein